MSDRKKDMLLWLFIFIIVVLGCIITIIYTKSNNKELDTQTTEIIVDDANSEIETGILNTEENTITTAVTTAVTIEVTTETTGATTIETTDNPENEETEDNEIYTGEDNQ